MSIPNVLPVYDRLQNKVLAYFATIWREKWKEGGLEHWIANFADLDDTVSEKQKLNMLYLLSRFMYFGNEELRELLNSLFRDLFKYPIVASIRRANGNTMDEKLINNSFSEELEKTRFLGVGNPSESGVHILYYFRQECDLPKTLFINASDVFVTTTFVETLGDGSTRTQLKSEIGNPTVRRYVFLDDFCGSGSQASDYLANIVDNIKSQDSDIEVNYFMLFSTDHGLRKVRNLNKFDRVESVFSLDETFRTFSQDSRYFQASIDPLIEKTFARETAYLYGSNISPFPLGYRDCQLLLAMSHNTPDNTLPIFWSSESNWNPIFKRYAKIYS